MFSFLTEPSYPKAALGLERSSVSAVEVSRGGKRSFSVRGAAVIPLANGVLIPSFTERNILDVGAFRSALLEAMTGAGLMNRKRWSVSLPAEAARSAILTVEDGGKGSGEEILEWKAEQMFGLPARELRVNRRKIASEGNGRSRYFATAVRLTVIDEYESMFEEMGLHAGLLLPKPVAEARWLSGPQMFGDSLLISSHEDGFTAILLRGGEVSVLRSVTCAPAEIDDEVYRLLLFYNDRFGSEGESALSRVLALGSGLEHSHLQAAAKEALGRSLEVLSPGDVGFMSNERSLPFDVLAAPAGLASLGYN